MAAATMKHPLSLADCGDTLTDDEVCRVLRIGRSLYYDLLRHRKFPIKPLAGLGVQRRYAKVAVEAYLASSRTAALRRVG